MDRPPKEPGARQKWLANWVGERAAGGRIAADVPRRRSRFRHAVWRLRMLPLRFQRRISRGVERLGDRVLDRGMSTSGQVLEPEHDHPDRVQYVPSAWHVLPRALRLLGVSEDDVFVDFGCGKGRVLHQAAKHPFRRVIGVEISPALAEQARIALAAKQRQHRCKDVEVVVADVASFPVPDDLTVAYLFHPFRGETFDSVLRRIIESIDRRPRRVRLIYVHPYNTPEILETGRFRLLIEQHSRLLDNQTSQVSIFESV